MRRRIITSLVVAALVGGSMYLPSGATAETDPPAPPSFDDVPPEAFFADAVDWLVDNDITTGFGGSATTFAPNVAVSRGQMAAFLWRMMGEPEADHPCGFDDIPAGIFYDEAACWLLDNGITTGFGGSTDTFAPNVAVTRGQMAAFLWRLAGEPAAATECGFDDVPAEAFYDEAVCWLLDNDITTGFGGQVDVFAPNVAVNRGQMAAFLWRLSDKPESWRVAAPLSARFDCEVLDPRSCLLPFPSDHFTTVDLSTDTGLRVNVDGRSTPKNWLDIRIDPTDTNRSDGFSPGAALLVHLPGVDLDASGAAPQTDIGSSLDPDSAVVIIDTETGERHPHWVENDTRRDPPNPDDVVTFIRPAVNFREGVRYVVALRNLVDGEGLPLEPSPAFAALRDETAAPNDAVEERRARHEQVFSDLDDAGIAREGLYLAWEFTVASERSLSERLLHLRDDAFADLGDDAPSFEVTTTSTVSVSTQSGPRTIRRVVGTIAVPNYLTSDTGAPGSTFTFGEDGLPLRNETAPFIDVPFWCQLPDDATADEPTRLVLAGHGLLGRGDDIFGGFDWAVTDGNLTLCAVTLWGMSIDDLLSLLPLLEDLGTFATLPDRGQQSLLNMLFLGRALKHDDGFGSHEAFQDDSDDSVLDTTAIYYNGNSMGGIMGGALMAVAQDFTRALLGVPGMNYSTLLDRSILGEPFQLVLEFAYPADIERYVGMNLIQMQWDRSEANGYAHHILKDPYHDTPVKDILIFMAYSDEAVANITTENMARTMGVPIRQPALRADRGAAGNHPDVEPFWGIEPIAEFPHQGSAMIVWDFEVHAPPPIGNVARDQNGPHSWGARLSVVRNLIFDYLDGDGTIVDPCGGAPCFGPRDVP